jgi:hypothetical protein
MPGRRTPAPTNEGKRDMRAETQAVVDDIRRSLALLRRHL